MIPPGATIHIDAFTMWLAGGGVKAGAIISKTDELGFNPVEDRVHVHDMHATILHLLGLDHCIPFQGRDLAHRRPRRDRNEVARVVIFDGGRRRRADPTFGANWAKASHDAGGRDAAPSASAYRDVGSYAAASATKHRLQASVADQPR